MEKNENEEKLTIEESFEKLEEILEKMESEETGLEASFTLYEEGMKIVRQAEEGIDRVEKRLKVFSDNAGGGNQDGI